MKVSLIPCLDRFTQSSDRCDLQKRFDRSSFVHGIIGFLETVQVCCEVEDQSRIDASLQNIFKQFWDISSYWRYASSKSDVTKDNSINRYRNIVWGTHSTITNNSNGITLLHTATYRRMMTRTHHIGEREQGAHDFI